MKLSLNVVRFMNDVQGPGIKRDGERDSAHFGRQFVSLAFEDAKAKVDAERKRDHRPRADACDLTFDTEMQAVVLRKAGAVMVVPWVQVQWAEVLDLEKATAPKK